MYEDLMAFWRDCYKDRIYTLSYEKLTMDPEEQIRNLTKFLGLEWERACLAPHKNKRVVRTSSQRQITQPIYQGSSDAWQDYEPYILGVFDDILDQRG